MRRQPAKISLPTRVPTPPPMRISDVIAELEKIRAEHGDLVVQAYRYSDCDYFPVRNVDLDSDRRDGSFVLIEP